MANLRNNIIFSAITGLITGLLSTVIIILVGVILIWFYRANVADWLNNTTAINVFVLVFNCCFDFVVTTFQHFIFNCNWFGV